MSKRKSLTNLATEIQTMAMILSQAGVAEVTVSYDGKRDMMFVEVSDVWSMYVPMAHDDVQFQLVVIRDRLDRLMDRIDMGSAA